MPPRSAFAPRVSIVTGAASGIGKALATELVARGGHVVVVDRDGDAGAAVAAALTAGGPGTASARTLDVTDAPALRALVAQVAAEHGRLDLMCNNAGVLLAGPFVEMDSRHWDLALDVNVRAVVEGTHAAYTIMCRQGHGDILNTGSLAGLVPAPAMAPYTLSKWAVVGFTQALRAEAPKGVNLTVVCPAVIDTPLIHDAKLPTQGYAQGDFPKSMKLLQPRLISPERVALEALDGLARRRGLVVVGASASMLARAQRFTPGLFARGSRVQVALGRIRRR